MPIKKKVVEDSPQADIEEFIGEDETPGIGHNQPPEPIQNPPPRNKKAPDPEREARKTLVSFYDRVQNLREQKKELAEAEKQVFAEAKAAGFDVKALKAAIAAMNADKDERDEFEQMRDFYLEVLEARV